VGLSSGKIFFYKKRNMDSRSLLDRSKEHEMFEFETTQGHKVS
jgi:WD40 repeat protein